MTTQAQETTIIRYDEIRKGDLIRVTYPYPNTSTVEILQGVAHEKSEWGTDRSSWRTEYPESRVLASSVGDGGIIELLDRPVRKLPQEIGSVIKAKKVKGHVGDFTLFRATPTSEWDESPWILPNDPDGDYAWVSDFEIEDWTEMVLTAKEDN